MDLSVEKMVTRTSSINQNYKENTLKVVTMYSLDHLQMTEAIITQVT